MEQPPLPGMPAPVRTDRVGDPITQEHIEVRVYAPTPSRSSWFVITTHRAPGTSTVSSFEVGGGYTPSYVGRVVGEHLEAGFLHLEPF